MISKADLARALAVDPAVVTRLEKRGMPVYSVEAAQRWRATNIRPRARTGTAANTAAPTAGQGNGSAYWDAKTRREIAEAAKAEMEAKRMSEELVDRAAVDRAAYAAARLQRDTWLTLPAKCAAELAAMTSPQEVEVYLRQQIDAILAVLARTVAAASEAA